jgi:dihydrofolate reductase
MSNNSKNKVFIATSLDGFIADNNGSVDFLYKYPEPEGEDMGYYAFMEGIDALVMGRKTFETVLGFGIAWPYKKPVFVWSTQLKEIPSSVEGNVQLIQGGPQEITQRLHEAGYHDLYIDGGLTIQSFLREGLIDELIITIVPVLLGSGVRLFGGVETPISFHCIASKAFSHGVVQSKYIQREDKK